MTRYIALLRGVNVSGSSTLPMAALRSICAEAGFTHIETYIASGNAVFDSRASPAKVKAELEARLVAHAGKPIGVITRTAAEIVTVLKANPFPQAEGRYAYAIFLDHPPPRDALDHVAGRTNVVIPLGKREIFEHYPTGMGRSELKITAARAGTALNMNAVAKRAEIAPME